MILLVFFVEFPRIVIQDSNCQIITVVFLDGKEDSREGLKIPYLKVGINGATKSSSDVIIGLSFCLNRWLALPYK